MFSICAVHVHTHTALRVHIWGHMLAEHMFSWAHVHPGIWSPGHVVTRTYGHILALWMNAGVLLNACMPHMFTADCSERERELLTSAQWRASEMLRLYATQRHSAMLF